MSEKKCYFKTLRECILDRALVARVTMSTEDPFGTFLMGFVIGMIEAVKAKACFPDETLPTAKEVADMTSIEDWEKVVGKTMPREEFTKIVQATLQALSLSMDVLGTASIMKEMENKPATEAARGVRKSIAPYASGGGGTKISGDFPKFLDMIQEMNEKFNVDPKPSSVAKKRIGPAGVKGNGTVH